MDPLEDSVSAAFAKKRNAFNNGSSLIFSVDGSVKAGFFACFGLFGDLVSAGSADLDLFEDSVSAAFAKKRNTFNNGSS